MINGYKSFLISKNLEELSFLLEGYIDYSDTFKEKLFIMKDKSPIAEFLLDLEGDEFEDDEIKYTFINTTSAEDRASFLSQKKVTQLLDSGIDEDDLYDVKGRNEIAIGRLVRGLSDLAGRKFSDKEIETFVNNYKAKTKSEGESFKLVSGSDISDWYDESSYYEDWGEGSLSNSCMRDCSSSFFDIYCNSPSCQMLILTKKDKYGEEKLIGRALVWKLKEGPSDYFMDRIYCMRDSDAFKFMNYADEKGWLRKKKQSSVDKENVLFILNGKDLKSKLVVSVDGSECDEFPFVDTLSFINDERTLLSNIGFENGRILGSTDGSIDECEECEGKGTIGCPDCNGSHEVECPVCGGECRESCPVCDGNGGENCEECDGNGTINCDACDDGFIECKECDGDGSVKCEKCDGDGEIEGKPCKKCDGDGYRECKKCDGDGSKECKKCGGDGYKDCEECDGEGKTSICNECNGDGEIDCRNCNANGEVPCTTCKGMDIKGELCPECTGLIKLVS